MSQSLDEQRFRALSEHSLDALALIDADGTVSYVSPSIDRVLGYTPEEFAVLGAFAVVHADDRQAAQDRFAELLRRPGGSQTTLNRVRDKGGSWRWIETVATNQLANPSLRAVVANFRDVTEQRRIEAAFREQEDRFRLIVESATGFAIFTADLEGRFETWNVGAERIFGYGEAEVLGRDLHLIFTREDRSLGIPEQEMRAALGSGRAEDVRWHVRKDGSRFWADGLMMPLKDDNGRAKGFLKIVRDRTAEKRAEEALEDANRRRDEFLAMLAHELRNPLAAIRNAEAVASGGGPDEVDWALQVIRRQVRILSHLIGDLLDVSRVTQGKIRLKKTLLDADPVRLEQILANILGNAAKYTPPGGRIQVKAGREGGTVVIQVEDNGVGVPADQLPHIFELFVQADQSLDRAQGGLGIGLTLVKTLVEMHGGEVSAESAGSGKGSEFTIRLPAADAPEEISQSPDEPSRGVRGRRILVVDDNVDGAIGLQRLLETSGHDVEVAHDGPRAVDRAREFRPEAVLLDIGLPGMDGYQVAETLRGQEDAHGMLIIAVSGYGGAQARERSRESGIDHYLVKPVSHEALLRLIETSC